MQRAAYTSLQKRLWRWHFFAGLMVLPFAILLSITGAIYLFKPQYNAWVEDKINAQIVKPANASWMSADDLMASLQRQYPDAKLHRIYLPKDQDPSVEFELKQNGNIQLVWVNRFNGEVVDQVAKSDRLMEFVKDLHGELLAKDKGSYLVEFMASWMIVLLFTGLYLWWPRDANNRFLPISQALLPALFSLPNRREKWRAAHGAVGIWLSIFVLILLLSGLPWTQVWGAGFKAVKKQFGWDGPGQEWFVTLQSSQPAHSGAHKSDGINLWSLSSSEEQVVSLTSNADLTGAEINLQSILAQVAAESLFHPIVVIPPKGENGVWTVRSMTPNRPQRKTIHYDKWSGEEIMRIEFSDHHPVQRLVSYGIAIHEGALFGWFNQLLGLVTALGIVFISISGAIIWWQRRPKGRLAAPKKATNAHLSRGVVALTLSLAAFLPMLMMSLACLILLELMMFAVGKLRHRPAVAR